jgi:GT2 family glycosyltransferase
MNAAAAPNLSILIVAWNCRDYLRRCLEALRPATAGLAAEIIVADNASSDGTPALLRERFPDVQLIEIGRNAGFAAAINQAADAARGEFLWLLNPDTVPTAECIAGLLDCLRRQPDAGAVGPRLWDAAGVADPRSARRFPTLWSEWAEKAGLRRLALRLTRLPMRWEECRPAPLISGAAICLRRSAVGCAPGAPPNLLDERFFLYAEDVDLCRRLGAAGWEVWYCGTAALTHFGGGSAAGSEWAGVTAVVSMGRLFEKWEGRRRADAYRAGVMFLSGLKLLLFAPAALLWEPARRKVGVQRRLIAALAAEMRHG